MLTDLAFGLPESVSYSEHVRQLGPTAGAANSVTPDTGQESDITEELKKDHYTASVCSGAEASRLRIERRSIRRRSLAARAHA